MKWRDLPTRYRDRLAESRSLIDTDPYSVLGVADTASDAELKNAYRKCAHTYHPDKQGEFSRAYAEEMFKIISAAYEKILTKRQQ